MKLLVLFCVFLAIACVSAAPSYISNLEEMEYSTDMAEMENMAGTGDFEKPIRHRRVTCDVLSFQTLWFGVNDSACAVRCLSQGRKGGRCENGVCVCR
ncbi:defensin 2 [Colletes latitarsis]|uniref:defensin 2 n=1 Tax=Colletes latitarsis TaxID=2605962 RepID=UPI004036C63C